MIKVKFFPGNSTNYDKLEKDVNDWLEERQKENGLFSVQNIKFVKDTGDREVMILYDDGYYDADKLVDDFINYCKGKGAEKDPSIYIDEDFDIRQEGVEDD